MLFIYSEYLNSQLVTDSTLGCNGSVSHETADIGDEVFYLIYTNASYMSRQNSICEQYDVAETSVENIISSDIINKLRYGFV